MREINLTNCCNSYSTYHDETLCCKVCWGEVKVGEGDGTKYNEINMNKFKFVESDEPELEDDIYELIENPNIYIQVNYECGFIVNKYTECEDDIEESFIQEYGIYKSLKEAKQKCITLNK